MNIWATVHATIFFFQIRTNNMPSHPDSAQQMCVIKFYRRNLQSTYIAVLAINKRIVDAGACSNGEFLPKFRSPCYTNKIYHITRYPSITNAVFQVMIFWMGQTQRNVCNTKRLVIVCCRDVCSHVTSKLRCQSMDIASWWDDWDNRPSD